MEAFVIEGELWSAYKLLDQVTEPNCLINVN